MAKATNEAVNSGTQISHYEYFEILMISGRCKWWFDTKIGLCHLDRTRWKQRQCTPL